MQHFSRLYSASFSTCLFIGALNNKINRKIGSMLLCLREIISSWCTSILWPKTVKFLKIFLSAALFRSFYYQRDLWTEESKQGVMLRISPLIGGNDYNANRGFPQWEMTLLTSWDWGKTNKSALNPLPETNSPFLFKPACLLGRRNFRKVLTIKYYWMNNYRLL